MSDEPSDAQKLIEDTIRKIPNLMSVRRWEEETGWYCALRSQDEVARIVAAEVDKALGGLTRQSGCDMSTKWLDGTRWVSGWTVTE